MCYLEGGGEIRYFKHWVCRFGKISPNQVTLKLAQGKMAQFTNL